MLLREKYNTRNAVIDVLAKMHKFGLMKTLHLFLRFYIKSSTHVALSVASLTAVTLLEFGFELDDKLLLFMFFGSVVGYNFVKYAGVSNLHHLKITPNIRLIRIWTSISFLGLIYAGAYLPISIILTSIAFGGLTILYAFPFYKGKNLRMMSGLKIYIIALVWAGATVAIPLIGKTEMIFTEVILEFTARFLFVLALTLPFEIRDLKYDELSLGTLPQRLGIGTVRVIGGVALLGMFVLNIIEVEILVFEIAINATIALLTFFFIWNAKQEQNPYYASFWAEGIPILWFFLVWLLHYSI